MEWNDQGLVLSIKRHGESSAVIHLLTRSHGRHAGLVRGIASRNMRGSLQIGNKVSATWRGRLAENLGSYTVESDVAYAARLLDSPIALEALNTICALALLLLPEREPHETIFDGLDLVLEAFSHEDIWPALLVRWEVGLLQELGFALDLEKCAVTGQTHDLTHVSPRTGRAVSRYEAAPYKERLLRLPGFLTHDERESSALPTPDDIQDGFRLSGHFLSTRALAPQAQALPPCRERMLERLYR